MKYNYLQEDDIPLDYWMDFKQKLSLSLNHLPLVDGQPVEIFNWNATKKVKSFNDIYDRCHEGYESISFTGAKDEKEDYRRFYLAGNFQSFYENYTCESNRNSFNWMIKTALILLNRCCPNCFDIKSDDALDDWMPVAQWLANVIGKPVYLPRYFDTQWKASPVILDVWKDIPAESNYFF